MQVSNPLIDEVLGLERSRASESDRARPSHSGSEAVAILVEIAKRRAAAELTNSGSECYVSYLEIASQTLHQRLSSIWQGAYFSELEAREGRRGTLLKAMNSLCAGESAYVKEELNKRIGVSPAQLFERYPEGVRRSEIIVRNWIDEAIEFVTRFHEDRMILAKITDSRSFGYLTSISGDKSDLHNGHRTVRVVHSGTQRVVYKPRSVESEAGFEKFALAANDKYGEQILKAPRVIPRDGYGWVEFIKHSECPDSSLRLYYWRCGGLLAVVTALRGTDYHNENIIASGGFPVPIDQECLLQPRVPSDADAGGMERLFSTEHTVLSTGLLPEWFPLNNGRHLIDVSGFGSLRNVARVGCLEKPLNLPQLLTGNRNHSEFADCIAEGFQDVYRFFSANKEWLGHLIIECFGNSSFRVVNRGTRIYDALIRSASTPDSLRQPPPQFQRLDLAHIGEDSKTTTILDEEKRSLIEGEIPLFRIDARSHDLCAENSTTVRDFASHSPLENALDRVKELCDDDLRYQETLLRSSFAAMGYGDQPAGSFAAQSVVEHPSQEDCLSEATQIARELRNHMLTDKRGYPTWLGFQLISGTHAIRPRELNFSLYDGLGGPLLFLAAYEFVTGETTYRDIVEEIVHKLEFAIEPLVEGDKTALRGHLGGLAGIPSIMYSLDVVSHLSGLQSASSLAAVLTDQLSPDLIFQDDRLDFLGGCAGLLAVLGASKNDLPKRNELMTAAVEHLSSKQCSDGGWITIPETRPLVGFAHGTSGILLQLARYGHQSEQLTSVLRNGLNYESKMFDPVQSNWPDVRSRKKSFKHNWCHGAPGTVLARRKMSLELSRHGLAASQYVLNPVIETLATIPMHHCDHICCGNLGISTILHSCDQLSSAKGRIGHVLDKKKRSGSYCLGMDSAERVFAPGFFLGVTGIGYSLLRCVDDRLPCVLTLDSVDGRRQERNSE